ncbi:glycosyltransferase family 4 protein [Polaribacter sargassicola]|uniref:glycosyltransferase family 4 protein n=1 Tax=Polaribacter sargassicola TaxID=2836891 RepID=UPI001F2B96EA|nr:glycosyltransferase family 1 protein [Polaribacter sp. DS7-9]MCG1036555.1 glycosyltransferase family 4 protein [Polaribacter sp. DS7-9]
MKVKYFFRKKEPQFNSIEELFNAISVKLAALVSVEKVEMPYGRINFKNIFKNLKYAKKESGKINHITGHINYVAIGLKGKSILTIHDVGSTLKGNKIKVFIMKIFWFWIPALFVNKITVISEFSKKELIDVIPFAKKKIQIVYNPVKEELKYVPKEFNSLCPKILLIGTKSNKNLENTIKSLEGISCELHIIGKLTEEQKQLLEKLEIKYFNEFFIPFDKIIAAYKNCDLLCFASTYEGFGMPIIEAQAIGRVVLTSNLGAMKEVAGNGAFLVNPKSISSIREGICKIIKDSECRKNLIQLGLENVERFKIDKITNDYLTIYKELAEEK